LLLEVGDHQVSDGGDDIVLAVRSLVPGNAKLVKNKVWGIWVDGAHSSDHGRELSHVRFDRKLLPGNREDSLAYPVSQGTGLRRRAGGGRGEDQRPTQPSLVRGSLRGHYNLHGGRLALRDRLAGRRRQGRLLSRDRAERVKRVLGGRRGLATGATSEP
jgi:hypothetical protein